MGFSRALVLPFGGSIHSKSQKREQEGREKKNKLSTSRCCSAWMGRNDRKGREEKERKKINKCE